jgi:Zn-dependent protease
MAFRLFGFDVTIQISFWITCVLFGFLQFQSNIALVAIWTAVVLVSILVHELGHAVMIRRLGIVPEISLHGMGGTTSWRMALPVSRPQHVLISLAGPFFGFGFALLIFLLVQVLPASIVHGNALVGAAIRLLMFVNLIWGLINLLPVLPFDGGHVLEHTLGPARIRWTLLISTVVGVAVAAYFAVGGQWWPAMLFGMSAFGSFSRWRTETPVTRVDPAGDRPREEPLDPATRKHLATAREALDEGKPDVAISRAEDVLAQRELVPASRKREPVHQASREALDIIAWAHLAANRLDQAGLAIGIRAQLGDPDKALVAALALARGLRTDALAILQRARAEGDQRKEIFGPLIRILIEDGEIAKGAATALDVFDGLSTDDARTIADAADAAGAHTWAARLYDACFARDKSPEDAYAAARSHTQDGAFEPALQSLAGAVAAGFGDRARVWSDAALAPLRAAPRDEALEALLPRP